jgi:prepilin-type N-terminal cleavage/methylation domain-containing protein
MQIRKTNFRAGFTLLELMIVVAIIGLLAAIAIPNFTRYQARSRRSEAFANLTGLSRAQKSVFAETDAFMDSGNAYPDPAMYGPAFPGTTKMPWDAGARSAFGNSGWAPEGDVFYSYGAFTDVSAGPCCATCWTAVAYGDVDGNGAVTTVHYVHAPDAPACIDPILGNGTPVEGGTAVHDAVAAYSQSEY